jgi:DNA-directed RNA polymerase specialized sigma24 family protein
MPTPAGLAAMAPDQSVSEPQPKDPFQILVEGLRCGDNDAWRELVRRYSQGLILLARRRLDSRLRQKLDSEDVVQSVYRTFLRRHQQKPFQLANWESLWGLLLLLTIRRCNKWYQHFHTQKRELTKEAQLPFNATGAGSELRPGPREPVDPAPTPAEAALLVEMIQETLRDLDENKRHIILEGLLGLDDTEISREVGRTEYRVRQVRADFVQHVDELLGKPG